MSRPKRLKETLSKKQITEFQRSIYSHYQLAGKTFPWRNTTDPYSILVSEFMLQQTQTDRVVPKYKEFMKRFPSVQSLSSSPVAKVLAAWQGLGYNRRALYLHQTATILVRDFNGTVPSDPKVLKQLPGIGPYSSKAIATFAYNVPTVFIETNIRTVFIYYFFAHRSNISDIFILPLVQKTLDHANPREWYYALMDTGALFKKKYGNLNTRSKHYAVQSPFEGSKRQKRGYIVRKLIQHRKLSVTVLSADLKTSEDELAGILDKLEHEGFLVQDGGSIAIVS